ncbi:MAG: transposase [Synergistaceae bacterium]|nr:transposase [Synergistaceae bacterium]
MSAREKIAWLKGLLSGLELDGKDAKIYGAVAEAFDALATQIEEQNEQIESLRNLYDELEEECTALGEDITALEDLFDEYAKDEGEKGENYAASYVSVTCPSCSSVFYYEQGDSSEEDEMLECPDCGEKFSADLAFINNDNDQEEMDS